MSGLPSYFEAQLLPDPLVAKRKQLEAVALALAARKAEMKGTKSSRVSAVTETPESLLTPRSRYSNALSRRMTNLIGVLMRLSVEALDAIRADFHLVPGRALDVMQFVDCVGRHVPFR